MAWQKHEVFTVALDADLADEARRRAMTEAARRGTRGTLCSVIREGLRKAWGMDGEGAGEPQSVAMAKKRLKPL